MVDAQPIIHNLQQKADEARQNSRWWDSISWVGFFVGIVSGNLGKPSAIRSIVSWGSTGAMIFSIARSWSWGARADALQESVNEVRNAPEPPVVASQTDWQQKIAAEDVAPSIVRR